MNIEQLYKIFQKYPTISTDSRNCQPDSLFFALKGDKFDGNKYIENVLASGAVYAIGDDKSLPKNEKIILVDNVLQTLQKLANFHRKKMNAKIIAITGTNGKTTTKELLAHILSTTYHTHYTQGNLNNHIGVPLTLLQLNEKDEFGIIEMGANHIGEIKELCDIADPDYGLITNIGKAHLEGFGSEEGIIKTKTELYNYLHEKNGVVFVNKDNPILKKYSKNLNTIFYSMAKNSFVSGSIVNSSPNISLEWENKEMKKHIVNTQLIGNYNLENILAAICIGSYFNVKDKEINKALSNYSPTNNRSQNQKTEKNTLILDAYNANPSSMNAAIENFNSLNIFPKFIILGEMKELGKYSKEEHQKIISLIKQYNFDKVFFVGEEFNNDFVGINGNIFLSTEELINYLKAHTIEGYHILIKGSRGNHLEKIIPYL